AGMVLAHRAGATLADLEFLQFHPSAITGVPGREGFLVTEAIRGEGATLHDHEGNRFVEELAPRDEVALAIYAKLQHTGAKAVGLDMRHIDPTLFPNVVKALRDSGLDPQRELVPVAPAAHYMMGGIVTDLHGRSTVPGLLAVGESACTGLHGANRLASTSLLECLTSAKFTALADAREIGTMDFRLPNPRPWESPTREADPVLVRQDMLQIQHTMWNYAGVVRSPRRLTRARRILLELREEILSFYRGCHLTRELLELRNAVQTALLIVHAASLNPRSKGCHYVVEEE
ncbi:MAG TPA: FAD-binding protein, partial [Opitutus sp.]|nr:FAD-binding protein [Opitutus sp.]